MPKPKKIEVVSDKCRRCAMFGPCKGKILPPDEFCLGYKDRLSTPMAKAESPPNSASPIHTTTFISRADNGSICDNCLHELDGMCKLTWAVGLQKIKQCANFKKRIQNKEAV